MTTCTTTVFILIQNVSKLTCSNLPVHKREGIRYFFCGNIVPQMPSFFLKIGCQKFIKVEQLFFQCMDTKL